MTSNWHQLRRAKGKALIALFAATAAVAGGAQALVPAPAAALTDDNTGDCTVIVTDYGFLCDQSGGGSVEPSGSVVPPATGQPDADEPPVEVPPLTDPERWEVDDHAVEVDNNRLPMRLHETGTELVQECVHVLNGINELSDEISEQRQAADDEEDGSELGHRLAKNHRGQVRHLRAQLRSNRQLYKLSNCDDVLTPSD
jgi:hypothetical protein